MKHIENPNIVFVISHIKIYNHIHGEVPKRLKGVVSKTISRFTSSGGSNPPFSATQKIECRDTYKWYVSFCFILYIYKIKGSSFNPLTPLRLDPKILIFLTPNHTPQKKPNGHEV